MKHPLMIRFLIHTTVKSRDVNGNCYNFSKITSTKTGKSLFVNSGWGSDGGNIKSLVKRAGKLEWSEMHYTESLEKARRYNQIKARTEIDTDGEHNLTYEMILDLEK